MNILYRTLIILKAIEMMAKRKTFFRDRYFPTSKSDIFPTEEVLVEYKSGNKKMAPCVMPRKGGITIEREGYTTKRYTPPYIAPQRVLTIDALNAKGFGENLYSNTTPEQRQAEILRTDIRELGEMIDTREEFIASQAMLNNGYILKHYADQYGSGNYEEFEMRFYEGASNPALYTPTVNWSEPTADIIADLRAMILMLTSKGLPVSDLIVAPDVANVIINNEKLQKILDNRNIQIGSIAPKELPNGVAHIGTINVFGKMLDILSYDETYEDETGAIKQFMPAGKVILTAPKCGRGLYGAVSQIEQGDGNFHTYMAKRVPKVTVDVNSDVRTLKETSRPLFIPRSANPWVTADVLA